MERQWPLEFQIIRKCPITKARASILKLPHGAVNTPVFMPVGTYGSVKGLTPDHLKDIGIEILLGNTYHLGNKPGIDVMKLSKGLHSFMNWDRNILTDSGGFQMVSLLKFISVTEEGVNFVHHVDGSQTLLTPERSIQIQTAIGSDIMMQLDDVISSTTTGERVEDAMHRSIRWLDRCLNAIPNHSKQNLFPIIQGGLDPSLRNLPGFAIGGLSGGEAKNDFCNIVDLCTSLLPINKPRYLMGVGYTLDLILCTALGCDMFDCVYPTRTARFGRALTKFGSIDITNAKYSGDVQPIDTSCSCSTCSQYTRSYLHNLFRMRNSVGSILMTIHNLSFQKWLMNDMRNAILDDSFVDWVCNFYYDFLDKNNTDWFIKGLNLVNISIE